MAKLALLLLKFRWLMLRRLILGAEVNKVQLCASSSYINVCVISSYLLSLEADQNSENCEGSADHFAEIVDAIGDDDDDDEEGDDLEEDDAVQEVPSVKEGLEEGENSNDIIDAAIPHTAVLLLDIVDGNGFKGQDAKAQDNAEDAKTPEKTVPLDITNGATTLALDITTPDNTKDAVNPDVEMPVQNVLYGTTVLEKDAAAQDEDMADAGDMEKSEDIVEGEGDKVASNNMDGNKRPDREMNDEVQFIIHSSIFLITFYNLQNARITQEVIDSYKRLCEENKRTPVLNSGHGQNPAFFNRK